MTVCRTLLRRAAPFACCALTGCSQYASIFRPAGAAARSIGRLGLIVTGVLSVAAVLVLGLLFWAAVRRKGSFAEHAPLADEGGLPWIWIGGLAVPGFILSLVLVGTLYTLQRFPLHDDGHYRPEIHLVGRQWWWEVDYGGDGHSTRVVTANEIHIPTNWPIEIELESRDVIHSFWVPALHGKVDLVPGQLNHIQIQADTPGRYQGECAEFCGPQHAHMNFTLVAEPLPEYERWLAHEASPARAPTDARALAGRALFESGACGLCHRVRGTRASASVGPDLTHFASRAGLAANSYPHSRAYLTAWITHAQSLKPGAQMPDLNQFSGEELQSITHFLEGLE